MLFEVKVRIKDDAEKFGGSDKVKFGASDSDINIFRGWIYFLGRKS